MKEIVDKLNQKIENGLIVELPNGVCYGQGENRIRITKGEALKDILRDAEMGFCEAYMRGDVIVEGDLEKVLMACMEYLASNERKSLKDTFSYLFRFLLKGLRLIKGLEGKEVRRHYDLGNDFYRLWLDSSMTYSCAFFSEPSVSLEEAQSEKRRIIY